MGNRCGGYPVVSVPAPLVIWTHLVYPAEGRSQGAQGALYAEGRVRAQEGGDAAATVGLAESRCL